VFVCNKKRARLESSNPDKTTKRGKKPKSKTTFDFVFFKQSDISHKTLDATRECMNRNVIVQVLQDARDHGKSTGTTLA
jgi:ribosomal protein L16/L10AE